MRVGIDVRPALRRKTGVGRYLLGLVPALEREGQRVVAFSASWKDRLDPAAVGASASVDRRIPVRLLDLAWDRLGWPSFESLAGGVDVTHSPTPLPVPSRRAARVVTIHDLYFLGHPSALAPATRRSWIRGIERSVGTSEAVICVSHATAAAARERLQPPPHRLHVVHHGIEPFWLEAPPGDDVLRVRARFGIEGRFLLAVGALEARKNYPRLLSAFDRLRRSGERDLALVIAGPAGPDEAGVDAVRARLGIGDSCLLVGYQDDATLRALYRAAEALVMPSLDEGFGFPVLEAMAAGCPVVAAKAGALPEVAGEAALLVDPYDEESIAGGISQAVAPGEVRDRLRRSGPERARRFTWQAAARATAEVYARAVVERSGR